MVEISGCLWEDQLSKARSLRQSIGNETIDEAQYDVVFQELVDFIPDVTGVIMEYLTVLADENANEDENDFNGNHEIKEPHKSHDEHHHKVQYKQLIRNSRNSLRFALACLSINTPKYRTIFQNLAIHDYELHSPLSRLISNVNSNTDSKCRLLASRVFSNLITCNPITAKSVASDMPFSNDVHCHDSSSMFPSWMDMISESSHYGGTNGRGIIATIVATIHNLLVSLSSLSSEQDLDDNAYALQLAQNKLLICSFVRHMLPASAISSTPTNTNTSTKSETGKSSNITTLEDNATEWITILLSRLSSKYGLLFLLYKSTGTQTIDNNSSNFLITPEQVVLLHCIAHTTESILEPDNDQAKHNIFPLGSNQNRMNSSLIFIMKEINTIQLHLCQDRKIYESHISYDGQEECLVSAYVCLLDILSVVFAWLSNINFSNNQYRESSGNDSSSKKKPREFLRGEENTLLANIVEHLGYIIDYNANKNKGNKPKDLKLSEHHRKLLPPLVRLLGNLCYKDKQNQDFLRKLVVPFLFSSNPLISNHVDITACNGSNEQSANDDFSTSLPNPHPSSSSLTKRTGLHVLLSCTSLSYDCFPLREWSIISIRNALEDNYENQNIVEKLNQQSVAKDAASMQELDKMGLNVNMDAFGKVNVKEAEPKSS